MNGFCKFCSHKRCDQLCHSFQPYPQCSRITRFPHVCNGCPSLASCKLPKLFYNETKANDNYKTNVSDCKKGPKLNELQLAHLNDVLSKGLANNHSIDIIINIKDLDVKKPENRFDEEVALPNGRGKDINIGVIGDGELAVQAKNAGIDLVLSKEDLEELGKDRKAAKKMANITDSFVAQADMMPVVGRFLGPILGPRKKMPKPVPASVKLDPLLERLQSTIKVGVKAQPSIQVLVGTQDMDDQAIAENIETVLAVLDRNLEKGRNQIKSMFIKTTMGSVVRVI